MGIRRTVGVVVVIALVSGGPVAQAAQTDARSRSGAPGISAELAAPSGGSNEVTVHYSVSDMPHNTRVVLERRDSPKGRYRPVDSSLGTPGDLIDADPVDRPATYRVVLEGPRGLALASTEAGHVG